MSRLMIGVVLLALVGCGGSDDGTVFSDGTVEPQGGAAGSSTMGGSSSHVAGAGGSGGTATAAGASGDAGGTTVAAGAGSSSGGAAAGEGGTVALGGSSSGSGGVGVAGTGGVASGGGGGGAGGGGGGGGGGSGGKSSGGAGTGGSAPLECERGSLDCTAAAGCETYVGDINNCGECGMKCGVTQKCILTNNATVPAYCGPK